ncbi:mucin-5AC [Plodia interpunctella]|uniref:mucin-5AC n=1 Tax=Plodia interpunctella TaxID=58824 RepID=UPI00236756DE|nr:mucin-5AC [Plodia interpunctella]
MYRRSGVAACFLALSGLFAAAIAGPLGPLPTNVTSTELGIKEGSCAVGDVVYMPGDEFPGSSPCEKCACESGGVQCTKQRCEPRPGCKALHRPDHCCPTYQCECEQEGRVYGNGEKLVDPADPCRVCYCQGGEVVCRRIACFVRDDCRPRLVPGRCCPEYDNCPLRGVTSIPGMVPAISSTPEISEVPIAPKENIEQKITIKEITPVSEIPVITEVKIKEILPSPSIEVAEYSSSKSPLIPREATTEKIVTIKLESTETPALIEIVKPSAPVVISSLAPETTSASESSSISKTDDSTPSKISFSTQDSINSEIYPSNLPSVATIISSSSSVASETQAPTFTKSPIILEEEEAPIDHNPAFPPLPDDLSVPANHEDEIVSEQNIYNDHVSSIQEVVNVAITSTSSPAPTVKEIQTTSQRQEMYTSTEKTSVVTHLTSIRPNLNLTSTEPPIVKENSMLNLRSAIPTEILNTASFVPEDITGELDEIETTTASPMKSVATTIENSDIELIKTTEKSEGSQEIKKSTDSTTSIGTTTVTTTISTIPPTTSAPTKLVDTTFLTESPRIMEEQTTSSIARSNIATEVTSNTEISSLPVETSDQNPHEAPDSSIKDKTDTSTIGTSIDDIAPTKIFNVEPEGVTDSKAVPSTTDNLSTEIIETTEFVLIPLGSSESATDTVELIKISPDTEKNAAIIESVVETKKNNILADLINLVGDVASISDHTDGPVEDVVATTAPTAKISDSEELIPVNAGYKSKNSNWNLNSITEIPLKSKNQPGIVKQKVIEIEDDEESEGITDHAPPNDRVEPTTRRPIIDNVSDDMAANKTNKTDIEIIKQTYVPTAGSRPTKVILEDDKTSQEISKLQNPVTTSETETATGQNISVSNAVTSISSSEAGERVVSFTSTASTQ